MFKKIYCKKNLNLAAVFLMLWSSTKTNIISGVNINNPTTFFSQFINKGDLVFDVGAHIGKKTEIFLSCGAKVVCFEPQKTCADTLYRKFANNRNVIIVPKGLSYEQGYINFFEGSNTTISTCSVDWTTSGRFVEQGYSWSKPIKIEVTTLDEMIKIYGIPKFCKIDVENFEFEVLKGLSTIIPALSFEFTYERKLNAQKCLDYLTLLGYTKFNFAAGENHNFEFNEWFSAKILLEKIYKENNIGTDLWGDIYAKYK